MANEQIIPDMTLEEVENLLFPIHFKIEKKFYKIPGISKNYREHLRWGVKMTLISRINEYVNHEGILKTSVGSLSPDMCFQKLYEKIFSGEEFEAVHGESEGESKGRYHFVYDDGKLEVKPV